MWPGDGLGGLWYPEGCLGGAARASLLGAVDVSGGQGRLGGLQGLGLFGS